MRRIDLGHGPVRPDQPFPSRFPFRAPVGRRAGHDTALAEDHHLAHLVDGLTHQRDALAASRIARQIALDLVAHPFGTGTRLARTASAHDDPGPPVALWCHLVGQRPELEQIGQRPQFIDRQTLQEGVLPGRRFGCDQFGC